MDQLLQGVADPLRFLDESCQLPKKKKVFGDKLWATKSFLRCQGIKLRKAAITPIQLLKQIGALGKYNKSQGEEVRESHLLDLAEMSGRFLAGTVVQNWTAPSKNYGMHTVDEYEMLMSEIQLRAIVQNMDKQGADQQTDGDEIMVKEGVTISNFSRETLEVRSKVGGQILGKIRKIFDLNKGDDSVFRTKNGAPKILTKFKDKPYSYELLPEYADGSKRLPTVKAMNWTGKVATARVIRGFAQSTPVVQRLVIVPKLAPGQAKDDLNHGFRVCVNALINKCIKPDASTIPLAVDEIKKLANCTYFLQLDGANAYWSIPVCDESKRLTAFHTPDGIYCWNRLLFDGS